MTVSTLTNRVTYLGNGFATSFAVPFKVLNEDHLVVERHIVATGERDYTYVGTDYSYSGIGDDAGMLTLDGPALSSSYRLIIERTLPYTQELDLVNAGGFYPDTVEEQLDRTTMQIQQIASQANDIETRALMVPVGEEAPSYEEFAEAFRGSPGGNVMSIGTFASIPSIEISEGTNRIRTSNGTDYIYDENVDTVYVAANPLTAAISLNDRGFRLATDQIIHPRMFGADPSAVDNSTALTAFFTFVNSNSCLADQNGVYEVQNGIVAGGSYGEVQQIDNRASVITGRLTLRVTANIVGAVITNHLHRGVKVDCVVVGVPFAYEASALTWTNRRFDFGVLFEDQAQLQNWGGGAVGFARVAGVMVQTGHGAADNTFGNDLGTWYFYGCGSGNRQSDGTVSFVSSAYTAITRNGSAADINQNTTIAVATQPPAIVTSGDYELPLYVYLDGEHYQVSAWNSGAGTITVYPHVKHTTASSGTLRYVFGGGVILIGGDAGKQRGTFFSTMCAIGCINGALYPGEVSVTSQQCSIGYQCGAGKDAGMVGGSADTYLEANDFDVMWGASADAHSHTIRSENAMDISKVGMLVPRRVATTLVPAGPPAQNIKPEGLNLNFRGAFLHHENVFDANGPVETARVSLNRPYGEVIPLHSNAPNIVIEEVPNDNDTTYLDYRRLFGYRARQVHITGSGANKEPTGTLTVSLASEFSTHTINGGAAGASATFTTFTRPAIIQVAFDPANDLDVATTINWLVTIIAGK